MRIAHVRLGIFSSSSDQQTRPTNSWLLDPPSRSSTRYFLIPSSRSAAFSSPRCDQKPAAFSARHRCQKPTGFWIIIVTSHPRAFSVYHRASQSATLLTPSSRPLVSDLLNLSLCPKSACRLSPPSWSEPLHRAQKPAPFSIFTAASNHLLSRSLPTPGNRCLLGPPSLLYYLKSIPTYERHHKNVKSPTTGCV
jgi:hypothetical protein